MTKANRMPDISEKKNRAKPPGRAAHVELVRLCRMQR